MDFASPRLLAWRRDRRGTRVGFAVVEISTATGPLTISDVAVLQSHGSRFIALPAGAYVSGGQATYKNILKFRDIAHFRAAVIALVERFDPQAFDENGSTNPKTPHGAAA